MSTRFILDSFSFLSLPQHRHQLIVCNKESIFPFDLIVNVTRLFSNVARSNFSACVGKFSNFAAEKEKNTPADVASGTLLTNKVSQDVINFNI